MTGMKPARRPRRGSSRFGLLLLAVALCPLLLPVLSSDASGCSPLYYPAWEGMFGAPAGQYFESPKNFAEGGFLPHTYSIASGALPPGVRFDPGTGQFSGVVPAGDFIYRVKVTDSCPTGSQVAYGDMEFCGFCEESLGFSVTGRLPDAKGGVPYSVQLVKNGRPPYTFDLAGSLPAGLSFDSSAGMISGKPVVAFADRDFKFRALLRDSCPCPYEQNLARDYWHRSIIKREVWGDFQLLVRAPKSPVPTVSPLAGKIGAGKILQPAAAEKVRHDLSVADVWVDQTCTVHVKAANSGNQAIRSDVRLNVLFGRNVLEDTLVPLSLAPGASVDIPAKKTLTGTGAVMATIDADGKLPDANRQNNTLIKDLGCGK